MRQMTNDERLNL